MASKVCHKCFIFVDVSIGHRTLSYNFVICPVKKTNHLIFVYRIDMYSTLTNTQSDNCIVCFSNVERVTTKGKVLKSGFFLFIVTVTLPASCD